MSSARGITAVRGITAATGAKFDTTIKVADVGTLRARQRPGSDRAAPAEDSAAEDDYADDFECESRPASGRPEPESGRGYSDDDFESDYGDDDFEPESDDDNDAAEAATASCTAAPRSSRDVRRVMECMAAAAID